MTLRDNSPWQDRMAIVSSAIDQSFGEACTLLPMSTAPNRSPVPDTSRPHVKTIGVFRWPSHMVENCFGDSKENALRVGSRQPSMTFDRAAFPFALKQGDFIVLDRERLQFEIKEMRPDGVARIECKLFQLGIPSSLD